MIGSDSLRPGDSGIPPVTACNLALALLALPAVALAAAQFDTTLGARVELLVEWGIAFAVVGIALTFEDRSLADLGLRWPEAVDIAYLVATTAVIFAVVVGSEPLLRAAGLPVRSGTAGISTTVGLPLALAGALTTGVVEELLFRSYPVERLLSLTDSPLVAGGLTWAVFTVAHAPVWALGNLLTVAVVAAVLTAVYLRRRTLVPVAGAHALVWVLAVLGQFYG